jgi:AcrR family transcriptional regulator
MEDIANAAELSPGTLYLYFKNKEELFASLSLRILQYMIIRLEQVKNDAGSRSKDKLDALKTAMFDVYGFDSASIISMLHLQSSDTLRNLSSQVLSEFDRLSQASMEILTHIFDEGIAEGAFIDFSSKALADCFWSLFSGVILWETGKQMMDRNGKDMKASLDFAFDLFKRGILVGREQ